MDCLVINGYVTEKIGLVFDRSLRSNMDDNAAREDACGEYQSSLEDLTFNSKPHINMLTILAEENLHFAKDIVAIIEAQILKAPSQEKLPVLYLVDSIVKNVGGEYLAVFAKNLVTSFICVFEKVDENIRKSLFKLRSTWDEIFPLKKLYALDLKVNSCDPAWPVKPLPPTVNASIHVNPKFLKPSEEVCSARTTPPQPQPVPVPAPAQPGFTISEASLTQEQVIRQQLLAKQKQLLELQHKKIELELEQTKAQLAGGYVLTPNTPVVSAPVIPITLPNIRQPAAVVRPRVPPPQPPAPHAEAKPLSRDPRTVRPALPTPRSNEPQNSKKDGHAADKHTPEKPGRPEKTRPPKKEPAEEKLKTKSVSPMGKGVLGKMRHTESEVTKPSREPVKKDPRTRKHTQEEVVVRDRKRCVEREREEGGVRGSQGPQRSGARGGGKMTNGSLGSKHERMLEEKSRLEAGGNARTNARKRTRSRSRSRSPVSPSPKRKERRSPKSRSRSDSLSPSPSQKPTKPRLSSSGKHSHPEGSPQHGKPREDRLTPKKTPLEPRRTKRPGEERHSEGRDSHSPRGHSDSKETKENRWRSGWEESKHLKLSEDSHGNAGPQRRKSYNAPPRPTTPRTPKQHRLSVDANLQIPDALNLVNKRDLLRRASKSLESGEITQEHFLSVAHQIKQLFQYQKEKQQHCSDSWEGPPPHQQQQQQQQPGPPKKKTLLATPPPPQPSSSSGQPQQPDSLSDAELTYYQHKSKLRRTQLPHSRLSGGEEEWEGEEEEQLAERIPGESSSSSAVKPAAAAAAAAAAAGGGGGGGSRPGPRPSAPRDRERSRKEEQLSTPAQQQTPMIEEYNHGKEFPKPKHVPALRFKKISEPRETSEREWNSPLSERQRQEESKSGYDAPRRYGGGGPSDPRKHDRLAPKPILVRRSPPLPGDGPYRKCPVVGYERERLSPLHQKGPGEMSPVPRFESPNSEHSDDGPLAPPLPRPSVRRHGNASPGNTPPHVSDSGGHPSSRYDGGHPARPHPPGPGHYEGGGRFEGPAHFDGPGRFDGPPLPHGPMRGERFDGGPPLPQGRYNGPIGQHPQERFDGHGPGPVRFDGPGPNRFDGPPGRMGGPGHFDRPIVFQQRPMRFDGPHIQPARPMRFDGPGNGPMHFDGPGQRYNNNNNNMGPQGMAPPRYDCPPGQQGGPPRYMQPQLRPLGPTMFDGPQQQQQQPGANFNNNQCFTEGIQPQFGGAPPMPFPGQQNAPQGGNYNVPPSQPQPGFPNAFNQPGPQFYGSMGSMNAQPAMGSMQQQQQMNMMPNHQPFLPPNPVPFNQPGPQFPPAESHFRQVDVDDLLSSLVLTGIIKAPSSGPGARLDAPRPESTALPPVAPAVEVEEEEEEEQEEDDNVADLTSFIVEDMRQRYESVVTKLYTGIQCYSCGMRFTASQTDVYADHLDWHYRQNRSEKDVSKKVTHRRWYYSLTDWIEFEEIADLEERAKSMFFEKVNEEVVQKTQEAAKEKEFQSVKAAADVVDESCEICQEPFEMYWEEEEEEWHLKNAIRVDGATYHPSCFEDYKNTSSFMDTTPSPNKLLTENPLSAFVKREADEEDTPSCCAVVKQEEEQQPVGEPENVKEEVQGQEEVQVKMEGETPASAIS